MITSLFSYYFFLEDDSTQLDGLRSNLRSKGWLDSSELPLQLLEPDQPPVFFQLSSGNTQVLALYTPLRSQNCAGIFDQVKDLEKESGLDVSEILGKSHTIVTDQSQWDSMTEEVNQHFPRITPVSFDIIHGHMLRYSLNSGTVLYLAGLQQPSRRHAKFLGEKLPLFQLSLIRLQMISNLLRDRNQLILREKENLDRSLSKILHSQLVSSSGQERAIEELEEHISVLSNGYGRLAGDVSITREGCHKIDNLLKDLRRQMASEPSLNMAPELREQIFIPYQRRRDELNAALQEINSSRENHQAAIEVVRSRIDLLMSKENIETQNQIRNLMELNTSIQKQSLTFQFAAGLIEFIVLAYYSHSLWKALAPDAYHAISGSIQFLFVIAFSGNTVYLTHLVAEYLQGDHHVKRKLLIFSLSALTIFVIVAAASFLLSGQGAH